MTPDLHAMAHIADKAMDLAVHLFTTLTPDEVTVKGDRDTVTNVDLRIERELCAYLRSETPGAGFLGEEEAYDVSSDLFWTLDPVDGTANLVHGVPLTAISLALVRDGIPVVGVIATPWLNRRHTATRHGGSWSNGHPIRVSDTTDLHTSLVSIGDYAVGPGASAKNVRRLHITASLSENVERVRMFGSAAIDLAWVADGRTDAMIMLANKPWDTAAGVLIAREAGAMVTDHQGSPHTLESPSTVAANPNLIEAILNLLRESDIT